MPERKYRKVRSDGYVLIKIKDYPDSYENGYKNGFALEHRVVMSQILKRPLKKNEIVHHKNGDRQDNRPENLELKNRSNHATHHAEKGDYETLNPKTRFTTTCDVCNKEFTTTPAKYKRAKKHYCSTKCQNMGAEKIELSKEKIATFNLSDNGLRKKSKKYTKRTKYVNLSKI